MDTIITESTHPVMQDMPADWPYFLGYNRVIPKDTATTVLKLDDDPLLSVWQY
ncbi:MAG: cytoplasmic protein, partial [Lentisphaeria bacterium]|nr:cytoplasmic protein [Lentisphaeria bacterium]